MDDALVAASMNSVRDRSSWTEGVWWDYRRFNPEGETPSPHQTRRR